MTDEPTATVTEQAEPSRGVVLLDVDGTLVDSTYLHALAWSRTFDGAGLFASAWRVHRSIGMGGDKIVGHLFGDDVENRLGDTLRDRWLEEFLRVDDEVHPLPGAADLVRHLHDSGLVVALASSGEQRFVDQAVDMLKIGDVIDVVTTNADVDASKPDPDLIHATMERAGSNRGVMVGDSPFDVHAASKAGLATVCVRTGGFHEGELLDAGAAVVVDEPGDAVGLDWNGLLREVRRSS